MPSLQSALIEILPAQPIWLNASFIMERFVPGGCNNLVLGAAKAVARELCSPKGGCKTLFVYGSTGTGKTHLAQATAQMALDLHLGIRVVYLHAEDLVNAVGVAIREKTMDNLQQRLRYVDLLVVDEMQFLSGGKAPASEQELFHTVDVLQNGRKAVVFAGNLAPLDMELPDAFQSRLMEGIVDELLFPDHETLVAILRSKARRAGHSDNIPDEVLRLIVESVEPNIRVFEGALASICLHLESERSGFGDGEVLELIQRYTSSATVRKLTIGDIVSYVATRYGVEPESIIGPCRKTELVWPRHLAIYLARAHTGMSVADIGREMGKRDQATVSYAVRKISKMVGHDMVVASLVGQMEVELGVGNSRPEP